MHKSKHIRIRDHRRNPPDLKKLSRALIELARAGAEAEAAAEQQRRDRTRPRGRRPTPPPEAA